MNARERYVDIYLKQLKIVKQIMPLLKKIAGFYAQAWRSSVASSTGRHLWLLLLLKIAILLVLFKILFFPDRLQTDYATDAERAEAVRSALTE